MIESRIWKVSGGGQKPHSIRIRQATKEGSAELVLPAIADLCYPSSTTRRARAQGKGQISPALCTENLPYVIEEDDYMQINEDWVWQINDESYLIRIRKLTPRSCWRLMGFSDEDFDKAAQVNSNTQLYKQAGNSIVVNCLEAIFRKMM